MQAPALSALESGFVTLPKYVEWPEVYIESLTRCTPSQRDPEFESTSQALELLQKGPGAAKDHIENEIEKYLCSNPQCLSGPDFKRKKPTPGEKIVNAEGNRYCSEFCHYEHDVI